MLSFTCVHPPSALPFLQYFRGSLCQSHQTYCLNYSAAIFYLESLRQRDDFGIYLKVKYRFLFFRNFSGAFWVSCVLGMIVFKLNGKKKTKWSTLCFNYKSAFLINRLSTAHLGILNGAHLETLCYLISLLRFWLGLKNVFFVHYFICGRNWYIVRRNYSKNLSFVT